MVVDMAEEKKARRNVLPEEMPGNNLE